MHEKPTIQQLEELYAREELEIDIKVSGQGVSFHSKGVSPDQAYDLANLAGYQYKQQSEAQVYLATLKRQKEFQLHCIAFGFVSIVALLSWVTLWRGIATAYHHLVYEPAPVQIHGTASHHIRTSMRLQLLRYKSSQSRLRQSKHLHTRSKKVKANGIRKFNNRHQHD